MEEATTSPVTTAIKEQKQKVLDTLMRHTLPELSDSHKAVLMARIRCKVRSLCPLLQCAIYLWRFVSWHGLVWLELEGHVNANKVKSVSGSFVLLHLRQ